MGEVDYFEKEATDVSLSYYDKQNRIKALEAELDRLLVLYEDVTLQDMLVINKRISEVNAEIDKLKSDINYYENQSIYSTINLTLYAKQKEKISKDFGNEIGEAFLSGFEVVVSIFQALIILLAGLTPVAIVLAPVGVLIFFLIKKRKKKRQLLNEQLMEKINSRAN